MKKRILSFILVVATLFSITGAAFAESTTTVDKDMSTVADITKSYLEESAYSRYFYEPRATEQYTISSISENERMALSQRLASYSTFRAVQEGIPYEETNLNSGNLSSFDENLALHQDSVAYYAHLAELEGITYKFFIPSYTVADCIVNDDLATVNIYETLDFQYSNCDEPSMMLTHYYVSLVKVDGSWLIAAVESDDMFYETYRDSGFDLQEEIAGVDAAFLENKSMEVESAEAQPENDFRATPLALASTDRAYIASNAVNYALTYSSSVDDGKKSPTFKNDNFYFEPEACQLFASQCIWAGFGGSNSSTSIDNKQGN